MGALRAIFWVLTMLGAVIGGGFLPSSFAANGAPQQAAAAAVGVGFAVLPYCFARAVSEMIRDNSIERAAIIQAHDAALKAAP